MSNQLCISAPRNILATHMQNLRSRCYLTVLAARRIWRYVKIEKINKHSLNPFSKTCYVCNNLSPYVHYSSRDVRHPDSAWDPVDELATFIYSWDLRSMEGNGCPLCALLLSLHRQYFQSSLNGHGSFHIQPGRPVTFRWVDFDPGVEIFRLDSKWSRFHIG